jgi:hypothetical protein
MTDQNRDPQAIIAYCRGNKFFGGIEELEDHVAAWLDAYPVEVLSVLKRLNAWLLSHPAEQKRMKKVAQFINGCLNKECGPVQMRPASINELMNRICERMDIKEGLKTTKPNEQARLQELRKQAELLIKGGK